MQGSPPLASVPECRHEYLLLPHHTLLFANLNSSAIGTQADVWPAFADSGAGRSIAALVIDVDIEIIHVNGAVPALGVQPKAQFWRHLNLDSSALIVNVNISKRRFWAHGNQA